MTSNLAYMDLDEDDPLPDPLPDPGDLWQQALELERQARAMRRLALRVAIEVHHGILQYVADAVGVPRSNIRNLFKGAHYAGLEERARKLRAKVGYKLGTVPKELRPEGEGGG